MARRRAQETYRFKDGKLTSPLPAHRREEAAAAQATSQPPSTNGSNGHAGDAAPSAMPPPSDGRDAAGRFAKGNRGGPGNPFARQVGERRKAMIEVATPERVADVMSMLYVLAYKGLDVAAAKVFLAYAVGRPAQAVSPDRLDVDELRLLCEAPTADGFRDVCGRVAAAYAAEQARQQASDDGAVAALILQAHQQVVRAFKRALAGAGYDLFQIDEKLEDMGLEDPDEG
jgi:hypothetical protein